MSRYIDAVSGEPSAVSVARLRSTNAARGGWPAAAATALHSSNTPSRKSTPPGEATISPTGARIALVDPASVARNVHFSHISSKISLLGLTSNSAPANACAIDPRGSLAVALTEGDRVHRRQHHDLTLRIQRRRDHALAAEHPRGAEFFVERIEMGHAVEQRQDRGAVADRRRKRGDGIVEVERLAAQQNQIEGLFQIGGPHRRRILQRDIAGRALDHQPKRREFARALWPHQKRHVAPSLQQPPAKISADRTRADN
jgi:hypothetical protein